MPARNPIPYTVIVDTMKPNQPSITSVIDDQGAITGNLRAGDITDDVQPQIKGTAEAGSTVIIYDNGVEIGRAPVDATGNWSLTPTNALLDGSHSLTSVTMDAAGNASTVSASTDFIVDTRPLIISITRVVDDVGTVTGDLTNGSASDDATPTVHGQATSNSTVTIYSNNIAIGTVLSNNLGNWSFTPGIVLAEGNHSLTATVTTAAAGESAHTSPFNLEIDTSKPLAQAMILSMSKDSGSDSTDFVTNDGSAGRLIQGTLTAALVGSERVQVSTDGGTTWLDAIRNSDSTWSFNDQNSHTANWDIQTRVINATGAANTPITQTVILDTEATPSPVITWDGEKVSATFDGADIEVGSKVHFIIDGFIVEHALSQAEIDAGAAEIPWSSNTKGNPDKISAALIDEAGNVSFYQSYEKSEINALADNFYSHTAQTLAAGDVIHLTDFDIIVNSIGSSLAGSASLSKNQLGWAQPPPTMALTIHTGTSVTLNLATQQKFNYIKITAGDFNYGETLTVVFRDQSNNIIFTKELAAAPISSPTPVSIEVELPYGTSFSSANISSGLSTSGLRGAFWINDIVVGNNEYTSSSVLESPETAQSVTQSAAYYGSDSDNIFSIADVTLLEGVDSHISGGAGHDTLHLTGSNQVLDLTALAGKLNYIEIIDIAGTGDNILKLSLNDVLSQGTTNLFINDNTTQMMINGNQGDIVDLQGLVGAQDPGSWASQGPVTVEGVSYEVYRHSSMDAELLVQQGVTTHLIL